MWICRWNYCAIETSDGTDQNNSQNGDDPDEIEVDIDKIDDATLRFLDNYVKEVSYKDLSDKDFNSIFGDESLLHAGLTEEEEKGCCMRTSFLSLFWQVSVGIHAPPGLFHANLRSLAGFGLDVLGLTVSCLSRREVATRHRQ